MRMLERNRAVSPWRRISKTHCTSYK